MHGTVIGWGTVVGPKVEGLRRSVFEEGESGHMDQLVEAEIREMSVEPTCGDDAATKIGLAAGLLDNEQLAGDLNALAEDLRRRGPRPYHLPWAQLAIAATVDVANEDEAWTGILMQAVQRLLVVRDWLATPGVVPEAA
jgi:hypothetical protein